MPPDPNHISPGPARPPLWRRALWFGAAYWACAQVSGWLTPQGSLSSSIWLPAGLYLAALLQAETREWPWLALAAFVANAFFDFYAGTPPARFCFFYAANTAQAALGAWLVRRFVVERPTLVALKEFTGVVGYGGVLSTMIGATLAAGWLRLSGSSHSFLESWGLFWGSCSMAVLILTPFILAWSSNPASRGEGSKRVGKAFEAALLYSGLAFANWYILAVKGGVASPYKSWLIPFLLWAGVRFGIRGATAANVLLTLVTCGTAAGLMQGVDRADVITHYVFLLQMVLAMASLVSVIPAIVLGERDRTVLRLRESEERFQHLTQAAFEGIAISEKGRILDMNDQCLSMFGYERAEMVGRMILDIVAPESRAAVAEAIEKGQESIYEHRLLRKDGSSFQAEARAKMGRVGGRTLRMTALRDITARKEADEALRKSEEKFSRAFRASPDGMAISELASGRYIEVNEGYCRLYGHSREEMIGRTSVELGVWEDARDREKLLEQLGSAGIARDMQLRTRTRDGAQRIVLLSAEPIELGGAPCIVSVLHDVTDRIRAEQALRESEEKFSKAFQTSPDMMSITDFETDRYLEINEAHIGAFGFKREEVIGRTPFQLGILKDLAAHEEINRALTANHRVHNVEIQTRTKDGRELTLWHSAETIMLGGRQCVLRVSHDITEQRRAEQGLRQAQARELQVRLEFARDLLAAQERERERLARELHDSLGQNLSIIKNRASLARQLGGLPLEAAGHLDAIERVVTDAIAETRNLAHNLRPAHLEQVGLTESLRGLILEVSKSSSIHIERRLESVDDALHGDAATSFYRIAQEALNNLVKHSQARQASVTLERDVRSVRLRVTDDGVGFDPQAATSRGLGLTSIGERARTLGGRLEVQSAQGQGTQLIVEVPIADG